MTVGLGAPEAWKVVRLSVLLTLACARLADAITPMAIESTAPAASLEGEVTLRSCLRSERRFSWVEARGPGSLFMTITHALAGR